MILSKTQVSTEDRGKTREIDRRTNSDKEKWGETDRRSVYMETLREAAEVLNVRDW